MATIQSPYFNIPYNTSMAVEELDPSRSSVWLTVAATFIILSLTWHQFMYGGSKDGPAMWSILGCFPERIRHYHHFFDWTAELLQKSETQTYSIAEFGKTSVSTANPRNLEHILKTNFDNYPKGPTFQENNRELLGHGIFNSDGEAWRTQRKSASNEFSARSLRDLMVTSIRSSVALRLMPIFSKAMETGKALDVQDVLLRFTFESICRIGFGVNPGCLSPDLPTVPFAQAFDIATKVSNSRFFFPPFIWKLCRWLNIGSERRLADAVKVINQFANEVVSKRRQELQEKIKNPSTIESDGDRHSDLLSRFMLLDAEQNGKLYDDNFLRDASTNFILAGRDTSSVALSWFFWLLTSHPHVEQKIVQEVNDAFNARPANVNESITDRETLTYEELKKMDYLHAALTESLRLYPSVPLDSKYALKDDVLPTGMKVKKGAHIYYHIYAMGRLKSVWGEDAENFRPERWLTPEGNFQPESPFKFLAFNAGPRLCLGRDLAYLQMKSVAATLLRNFKFDLVPGHPVTYTVSLTLFLKHGLRMTTRPRNKDHNSLL